MRRLSQLELTDLVETTGPLADEAFGLVMEGLSARERRGCFRAARTGMRLLDGIVASFGEEGIRRPTDKIILIRNTVKQMTHPRS